MSEEPSAEDREKPANPPPEEVPEPPKPVGGGRRRHRWVLPAVATLWLALIVVIAMRSGSPADLAPTNPEASESEAVLGEADGRLEVTVLDGEDEPVAGATVLVRMSREGQADVGGRLRTDERGRARVLGLPDGLAMVTIEHPGFARRARPAQIEGGAGALRVTLVAGARLSGTVVDADGEGIEDAWVRVRPALDDATPPWETRTDGDGAFAFDTLRPNEPLRLEVGADGFDTVGRRVRSDGDAIRVALRRTGELAGTVTGVDGEPAGDAQVVLAGSGVWPPRSVVSGADGSFRFAGVPGGVYELRASRGDEVAEPREGIVLAAGASARIALRLAPGQPLNGTVVDAASGEPIPEAEVVVTEEALAFAPRAERTGEDGTFAVSGLRPIPHRVSVHAEGWVSLVGIEVEPGPDATRFELQRAATLVGVVLDELDHPVAGATVSVVGTTEQGEPMTVTGIGVAFRSALFRAQLGGPAPAEPSGELGVTYGEVPPIPLVEGAAAIAPESLEASFVTDARGRFRITGVPPGRLTLLAQHAEHAPGASAPLLVTAGSTREDLEIRLPRGGRIEGRVVDARGFPVRSVRVEMHAEREPFPRFALADDNGEFSFEGALATTVLTAYPPGHPPTRETITAVSGESHEVELALEAELVTLTARTVDDRGFPVAGAMVSLRSLSARSPVHRSTRSGEDGMLEIGALPPPPWRVVADHPDYAVRTLPRLRPRDVRREVSIELAPGTAIRGRVISDWSGEALAAARVQLTSAASDTRAVTDAEGRFELGRIAAGTYRLVIEAANEVRFEREVAHAAGPRGLEELDLDEIRVTAAGRVAGEVVDALGDPVSGAEVTVGDPPEWGRAVRTDARGRFALPSVPDGTHTVHARHPAAGEGAEDRVRVYATQETTGVRVRLPERFDAERADPGPGRTTGVGVTVADRSGRVMVTAVPGAEARRAGLRAGDAVVSVDDERAINAVHARGMLRGPVGVEVILEVRRGRRALRLPVPREAFQP